MKNTNKQYILITIMKKIVKTLKKYLRTNMSSNSPVTMEEMYKKYAYRFY